jgi:O-antigen ligase
MIWQSAGKILEDNPTWGIGPGNFQEKYLEYQKYYPPYLEWAVPHPHNLYLAFYLYSGILGLAAFLLSIFFWLKKIMAQKKEATVLVALGIIAYFLLHGMVDTTYFKNDLAVIFWLAFFLPL